MGFNYPAIAAIALKLITEFGVAAALRRPAAPAAWAPSGALGVDYPIRAVLQNYTLSERAATLIQAGDRKIIFAALGLAITPVIGDQLVIPGDGVYQIMDVTKIAPSGYPIVYTAQARR
jgi:hypothetical protein